MYGPQAVKQGDFANEVLFVRGEGGVQKYETRARVKRRQAGTRTAVARKLGRWQRPRAQEEAGVWLGEIVCLTTRGLSRDIGGKEA